MSISSQKMTHFTLLSCIRRFLENIKLLTVTQFLMPVIRCNFRKM